MTHPTKHEQAQNALSLPQIEAQISAHQEEIAELQRQAAHVRYPKVRTQGRWYHCTRCGALYMTFEGCGCAIPTLVDRIKELETAYG